MTKDKNNSLKKKIDLKIYPLEAVYGASSVFLDKMYIFLSEHKDKKIEIEFKSKTDTKEKLEDLEGEFLNELINYVHRINIAKNNKKIREHIVHRALFSSIGDSLLDDDEEEDEDDPLGIKSPLE